jgi:hypothetical protein
MELKLKNAVIWDVAPFTYYLNRRFGRTYRLRLQGKKIRERGTSVDRWLQLADSSTLKTEAIRSSETSVQIISTRRHTPDNGILHNHRRENLKSYGVKFIH